MSVKRGTRRTDTIDVHEMLKREMFAARSGACDDHFEKNRPCPKATFGVSDQYVILDSAEKIESSQVAHGEYKFNFNIQGPTKDQMIGVRDMVDTVIEIQVLPFYVPLFDDNAYTLNTPITNAALPELVANVGAPPAGNLTVPLSQLPYGNRIVMDLKEVGLQSIFDAEGNKHHFEFTAEEYEGSTNGADRILLTPIDNGDTYVFTDPIKDIHGITIVFRNPFKPINFPADVLYNVVTSVVAVGAQLMLLITCVDQVGTAANHNLNPDDRIYIRGFASGNAIIDNWVNRDVGHTVGTGGHTATAFRLNPDVEVTPLGIAAGNPIPSTTRTEIVIAKNRIRVPLRMRRVIPRLTNYITP